MAKQENGGSGAIIVWGNGDSTVTKASAGKWCSSFNAELIALTIGIQKAMEDPRWSDSKTISICLDNRGVVQKLKNGHHNANTNNENELWNILNNMSDKQITPIDLETVKNKVKTTITNNWKQANSEWKYNKLEEKAIPRQTRTEIARYRTGHTMLLKHYRHKIGREEDDICWDCQEAPETLEHNLLHCPKWSLQRLQAFGSFNPDQKQIPALMLLAYLRAIGRIPTADVNVQN